MSGAGGHSEMTEHLTKYFNGEPGPLSLSLSLSLSLFFSISLSCSHFFSSFFSLCFCFSRDLWRLPFHFRFHFLFFFFSFFTVNKSHTWAHTDTVLIVTGPVGVGKSRMVLDTAQKNGSLLIKVPLPHFSLSLSLSSILSLSLFSHFSHILIFRSAKMSIQESKWSIDLWR